MSSQTCRQIYQLVWECCAEGPVLDDDCRSGPSHATALLSRLGDAFLEQQVVESQVAIRCPDGLIINPRLAASQCLLALRELPTSAPFALVGSSGIVPSTESGEVAMLQDHRTRSLMQRHGPRVYIAFSMPDLLALRRQGLPAAPAMRAVDLDYVRWQEISRAFRWTSTTTAPDVAVGDVQQSENQSAESAVGPPSGTDAASTTTDGGEDHHKAPPSTIELILAAWSPANLALDVPEQVDDLVARCLAIEKHLGLQTSSLGIWLPTAERIASMQYCFDVKAIAGAHQILEQSSYEDVYSLDHYASCDVSHQDSQLGYGVLLRRFDELQGEAGAAESPEYADLHQALLAAADKQLVFPIFEFAERFDNPLRRNLIVQGAHIAREFYRLVAGQRLDKPHIRNSAQLRSRGMAADPIRKALSLARAYLDIYRHF